MNYLQQHSVECIAALAGLLNIYLVARNNILNFLFGLINVLLYMWIFYHAKLYADMGLQSIFLVLQFYGFYQWRNISKRKIDKQITHATKRILTVAVFTSSVIFVVICFLLIHYTDSSTVKTDAFITALSLVAQWMMNEKWIEHWYVWIIINVVAVYLYFCKGLYLTVGLYLVFIYLCVVGYRIWRETMPNLIKTSPNNE